MSRNFLIILTVIVLILASLVVIFIARGYQLDIKSAKVTSTGILVATSDPDGAQVIINDKLTTATNNTINLAPGKYLVRITKDGFSPWEKEITIKPEEVIKTSAFLFPNLPDLRPLTLTGATNPLISPDGTKIAYTIASASAEKNGLWIMDMSRPSLPNGLFSSANMHPVLLSSTGFDLTDANFLWSTDSKQILAYYGSHVPTLASPSARLAYLLDSDVINTSPIPITSQLPTLLTQWQAIDDARYLAETSKLNPVLLATLATTSAKLDFSPDENHLLYQATSSGVLPPILTGYLPGTNPTVQNRNLVMGNIYVYDVKEDRNYLIENCNQKGVNCVWFPSSRHLLSFNSKQISIMEFDGTNQAVVYAGPFEPKAVFPWPDWSKIVILTSLNSSSGVGENLYTINLR